MKTILKLSALVLPLLLAVPSFAHISWGVDIRLGMPAPPHEVIVARPFADAFWVPGYYNIGAGHRYIWNAGFWRRPEHFEGGRHLDRDGFRGDRDRGRREDRRGADHDRSRDHADYQRGRIR